MAYYDVAKAEKNRMEKEAYDNLKAHIGNINNKSEFFQAYFYMEQLERDKEELEKKLVEYRNFFANLQNLLPGSGDGRFDVLY